MTWQPPPSDELVAIQLRTLFRFDRLGRIAASNEAQAAPPPRMFVGRSATSRTVRVRHDVPEAVCRCWLASGDDALRALVEAHAPVTAEYRGPAFVLPPFGTSPGDCSAVGLESVLHPDLVARGWLPRETPPYIGVVEDGLVVALCYSARSSAEAAEAGVETAPDYRGRGLAALAVAGWAAAVQASGRLALYSTQWTNEPSRGVARKLGAIEYGEDWHLT